MLTKEQRENLKRKNTQRRKALREEQTKDAIEYRKKNYPIAISILSTALLLLLIRIIITTLSSEVSSGEIPNKGGVIGPFEMSSSELHRLDIDYSLKSTAKWCSLTVLLLDENKNLVTGANKDLYFEKDYEGPTYEENDMEYSLIVNEAGTYYFQFITDHSSKNTPSRNIRYKLKHHLFGFNFLLSVGLVFLGVGGVFMWYVLADSELTSFKPKLNSELSILRFKKALIFIGPIVGLLILTSLFKVGYADTENVPSTFFRNGDTHYFGK
ncbi:MAG: hypothetical protein ACJAZ2_000938 [Glaciecola sp.]|jgi:hypothetical protein